MLGYCFSRSAWGRGYASESGRAMLRFGVTALGLENIWAGCDAENHASIRVLEKLGMVLESRHPEGPGIGGEPRESLMFRFRSSDAMQGPFGEKRVAPQQKPQGR